MSVWPARGMRGVRATRSMLMLPTTTMGLRVSLTMSSSIERSKGDGAKSQDKKDEHQKEKHLCRTRGAGEFAPYEDTPARGDHGCALSDGVGDRRANEIGSGSNEVGDGSGAPYRSAEQARHMPAKRRAPVARAVHGRLAVERPSHQKQIGRD